MNKILSTDYSSSICTELNCNEPNFIFIFYIISFTFVVIYMQPAIVIDIVSYV